MGGGGVVGFAEQGTEAQESEGTCSGPMLAGQQPLRGSDPDMVCTAHAQPIEPKNRN